MGRSWIFILITVLTVSNGFKILGILPTGGRSHDIIGAAFMRALAAAGHEVTIITPYPAKNPPPNYHQIELTGMLELKKQNEVNMFDYQGSGPLAFTIMLIILYEMFPAITCEYVLKHPNVVNLLNSNEKFDAVLVETFISESLYGFAQHFNAPLITFSAFGNSMWTADLVGAPLPLSELVHFWDRFLYTVFDYVDKAYYKWRYLPAQKRLYDSAFPNAKLSFEQQLRNVSLVFLNQHFSVNVPMPYPPNMVEVGGIQVDDPKPLPEDLQKYLDESTDGIIYFCMGSNVKSIDFPETKRQAFLKAFAKLKQRVLWKFENDTLPNQPPNVMIKPWMPQNDILAHPNVKLFITHGGLLGVTESMYHGKPMVGIPIYGDQTTNVEKAVKAGYAVLLDYNELSEATIYQAIDTVLGDPAYGRNAMQMSKRFRDKPMTPKELAVYWVEYVIRYRGAPHLRSPVMDLTLLQQGSIDVHALLVVIILSIIVINLYITKILWLKLVKRKVSLDSQKKRS
ncbi:UDP-glycosyltransferase UGT5-like [Topomyia yanbarensis]|uniref:UDP-glycosyltransferase UGT5-like n=1 Tax=Topomyia yanbarensis TaxID=2498891 RepID=UPI00273CBD58|nr:UDP-glycosyltransferase UGT5-like [Topomyia yanbarensis]